MIAIILEKATDRLVSALRLSSFKDFKIYIPEHSDAIGADEDSLNYTIGTLADVKEDFVMFLCPKAEPGKGMLGRVNRTITEHPEFDVYHINLEGEPKFPLKVDAEDFFVMVAQKDFKAPLSSFVFRTSVLKEMIVYRADETKDPLATVISCIGKGKMRTVRHTTLVHRFPALTPEQKEERIWRRIEFLRWTESYWGDEDYPVTVAKGFAIYAKEVAKLYPSRGKDELKQIMEGFTTVKGPVRKLMASSALKKAIKAREEEMSEPLGQPVENEDNPLS